MQINVVSTFKGSQQAKEALEEIRISSLANSRISLVVRTDFIHQPNYNEEIANELTYVLSEPNFSFLNGWLVFSDPFLLPNIGEVIAAGPLATELLQSSPNKSLSEILLYYGLSKERSDYYEHKVRTGHFLILIEAESEKDSAIANTLQKYGGRDIEKWRKTLEHPLYPAH